MPDDIQLDRATTTGGDILAAKEAADGVKHQRGMLEVAGIDGEPIQIDRDNPIPVSFGDSHSLDASGRLRVSTLQTEFESMQVYGEDRLFETILNNGGTSTHSPAHACMEMKTTSSLDSAIRQTFRYIQYRPGKSQFGKYTFNMYGFQAGVTKRVGSFDANNGLFLENNGAVAKVVIRSSTSGSAVDTAVAQSSWNLDTMDGNGLSGLTLDLTKVQLLLIDYQWLGVGRVRFGFEIGGKICYVHEFNDSNVLDVVFMTNPHLPVRFEISQSSTTPGQLDQICCSIASEDGLNEQSRTLAYTMTTNKGVSNSAWTPIISIRPALLFNGQTNRKAIHLMAASILGTTAGDLILIEFVIGASLTGASWASAGPGFSSAEIDIAATAMSGGAVIHGAQGGVRTVMELKDLIERVHLALNQAGTQEATGNITIRARCVSGSANVVGSMTWDEAGN